MNKFVFLLTVLLSSALMASELKSDEQQIMARLSELSASMKKNGQGAKAYAQVLDDNYSRWTMGSQKINDKAAWLEGIEDWFESGWRVEKSDNKILSLAFAHNRAFVRRIATEYYLGPKGEKEAYRTGIAEVWLKRGNNWYLQQVQVAPQKLK